MRIEQETRNLYVGARQTTQARTKEKIEEGLKNGRLFSGKIGFANNDFEERRKLAQEEAMGIVKTAFAGEQALDTSVAEMKESIEKGKEEMLAQKAELNRIAEQKESLKERTDLTSEEYVAELKELDDAAGVFEKRLMDGKTLEERTEQALSEIAIERAKSSPMVEAGKEAEAVLADAGKQIISDLFEEAKEHIDAENDKKQAEAEEKAEKEKELEERIEAMKAEKEEREDAEAPALEQLEVATRHMVKIAETGEIVQKELKNVVDRMKLDLEDLKGAAVDSEV